MLRTFGLLLITLQLFNDNVISAEQRISYKKCHEMNFTGDANAVAATSRIVRSIVHQRMIRNSENDLGKVKTYSGEFPYMAALGWIKKDDTYTYACGGILISPEYILTTASCTKNPQTEESPAFVRIGGINIDDSNPDANIPITNIIVHPEYQDKNLYNDLALLKLETPSIQRPACLWQTNEISVSEGIALGYGPNSKRPIKRSKELSKVELSFYPNDECNSLYDDFKGILKDGIAASQFCIGDRNGKKGTCNGDSGGPIVVKINENGKEISYVVGAMSFGKSGCAADLPLVSTRVSSYLDWIESVVWS